MKYSLEHIARIVGSSSKGTDAVIEHLVLDSRKIYSPATSLFFALKGPRRDGHQFIAEVYKKGVRNFIISEMPALTAYPEANFILVNDSLVALQQLAAWHRGQFNIPVIGITGSNGKTIVKEWLYQLLHADYNIVRSPKSYNSQIGVPLSVWQMSEQNTLAIFEAGISMPGEMKKLWNIIRPTIGIITNIGEAHSEGFESIQKKVEEKIQLLRGAKEVIFSNDHFEVTKAVDLWRDAETHATHKEPFHLFSWGTKVNSILQITSIKKQSTCTLISASLRQKPYADSTGHASITIFFTDDASIENAITCWCVLLVLGVDQKKIEERMKTLQPVNMRLELKKGINHCNIINDSYSADLSSLEIALNFLSQQGGGSKKTVILSDFLQSSLKDEDLYSLLLESLQKHHVDRLIGIGGKISKTLSSRVLHPGQPAITELYDSTGDFIQQYRSSQFKEETVLIKGARVFEFEKIVQLLEQKVHQTVLEINLNAIAHNLKVYQNHLDPATKVMGMVKAFAYGSGGAEIAGILQYQKVDYLGVAYVDEGVELRKMGITLPIMVMNPEETAFESLIEYNLEPDIYSFELLHSFDAFLQNEGLQQYPVHIEIETGMNRLGFAAGEIEALGDFLRDTSCMKVQTVFSHLAASEDAMEDKFTFEQFDLYKQAVRQLKGKLQYSFIEHLANSGAIFRLPQLQLDMVRLGIGLYGVDSSNTHQAELQPVATLRSTIAQLKYLKAGESVSYNRKGIVKKDSVIATVRIGYADGFSRHLGNGRGKMLVKGQLAPVMGTVCMDMTMIDVTGIEGIREGDEVIIFGKELPVQKIAEWAGTIPYEIMTAISQRVKRVYFEE
ncbi:MAG: bifunctional UDP-N-acetylmuramoyl-tripeptide:D-alanyl-D-alanine ligase/alanine racemase [Bacteroidota bacterium]|nr:bifunctional UDP-N-acetylmuramoyl-tripeptide:D-alanyl-D-alanine ligase/alanine racemase [Bacteroidota bacterium]